MKKLTDRGHHVDIQTLDNEVSADFKKTIQQDWGENINWSHKISTEGVSLREQSGLSKPTFYQYWQEWTQIFQNICGTTY